MGERPTDLTDAPTVNMPGTAMRLAKSHPDLWAAYQHFGALVNSAGPLTDRERRLVHLAYALGSTSEGAAHSHARRALAEGMDDKTLEHVALLAATTLGWPKAVRALSLLEDVIADRE